jgi:hypothetical protein
MSKSLRSLQEGFAEDVIFSPSADVVSNSYLPRGNFSGKDFIDVYRNNYVLSLTEALAASYSAVKRLVGEDFFFYIAKQFVQKTPLTSGYLTDFGDEFADFLETNEECKELSYLPCIARLERFYEKAYHSAEIPAYEIANLASLGIKDESDLYINFHPSVYLLESSFPVVSIWLMDDQSEVPDLNNNPQKAIIYRRQYKVQVELINQDEFDLLGALMKNNCLNQAYALTNEKVDLQPFLAKYIERQVFVDFYI